MKITLNNAEIEAGLVAYIGAQGISLEGKNVEVDMTAGRGPNGYSADVTILPGEGGVLAPMPSPKVIQEKEDSSAISFASNG